MGCGESTFLTPTQLESYRTQYLQHCSPTMPCLVVTVTSTISITVDAKDADTIVQRVVPCIFGVTTVERQDMGAMAVITCALINGTFDGSVRNPRYTALYVSLVNALETVGWTLNFSPLSSGAQMAVQFIVFSRSNSA